MDNILESYWCKNRSCFQDAIKTIMLANLFEKLDSVKDISVTLPRDTNHA